VAIVFAATNGYLDGIAVERLREYEDGLFRFLDTSYSQLLASIAEKKTLDDDLKAELSGAIGQFNQQFTTASTSAA
jgi:F-type H+-transporting ATPase subunit alpha